MSQPTDLALQCRDFFSCGQVEKVQPLMAFFPYSFPTYAYYMKIRLTNNIKLYVNEIGTKKYIYILTILAACVASDIEPQVLRVPPFSEARAPFA